jgi:hypothetical protein
LAEAWFFRELARIQASLGITGVFHSEDGLYSRPFGPVQREAARAFIEGYRLPRIDVSVPPLPSCAERGDPYAIVECERSGYGRMDARATAEFMRSLSRSLTDANVDGAPFGVLIKTTGNQCEGLSCDVICSGNGGDQRQWDVLGDVDGAQIPTWSELSRDTIAVRDCEVQ